MRAPAERALRPRHCSSCAAATLGRSSTFAPEGRLYAESPHCAHVRCLQEDSGQLANARCNRYVRYKQNGARWFVAFSQPINLHNTARRVWLSGQNLPRAKWQWQHRTIGCRLPYSDSTDVPRVRRHKHEEDVAIFGDSCSHAEQPWLLLLPMAIPNAGAPPVAACPAPVYPAPAPVCNPCTTAPVTYGAPGRPLRPMCRHHSGDYRSAAKL